MGTAEALEPDFRPRRWPLRFALVLNLLLGMVFLGWAYVRGRIRARQSRHGFAAAVACLTGARASPEPGVVLPDGLDGRYARQVAAHAKGWPGRCVPLLRAVAPAPSRLLFPAVKAAEAQVHEAASRVEAELDALDAAPAPGARTPSRPFEALERLAAAVTVLARAADATDGLERAVTQEAAVVLRPTRLPLDADAGAQLWPNALPEGLSVVGIGRRRVGWTRATGGHVRADGDHRPPSLRAARFQGTGLYFLWSTAPERCATRSDGCRQRATGISRGDFTATALSAPVWIAGHPASSLDQSLTLGPNRRVDLLALGPEATPRVWKSFDVTPHDDEGEGVRRPLREHAFSGAAAAATVLADGSVLQLEGREVGIWSPATGAMLPGGRLRLSVAARGLSAQQDGGASLFAGPDVHWLEPGRPMRWRSAPAPADVEPRSLARVVDASGCSLLILDTAGTLWWRECEGDAWSPVARQVHSFEGARAGGEGLVAFVRRSAGPARFRSLRLDAVERSPIPCFDRLGGFCGQPRLAVDASRIVAVVREGTSVLALETVDGGRSFQPARGL